MMMGESDKLKATVATLESELKAKESHITVLEAELRSMNRKLQSRDADITRQVSGYINILSYREIIPSTFISQLSKFGKKSFFPAAQRIFLIEAEAGVVVLLVLQKTIVF